MEEGRPSIPVNRPKLLVGGLRTLPVVVMIGVVAGFLYLRDDGEITDPGYYRGPMMNHKGELVDSAGHVIQRLPPRPPTRATK